MVHTEYLWGLLACRQWTPISLYNPAMRADHHRCSICLPRHDYVSAGVYFVTLYTHEFLSLFGQV